MTKELELAEQEKFRTLEISFVENVEAKRGGFEPNDNYCWKSVMVGYALAHGFSHDEAYHFAFEIYFRNGFATRPEQI
ncbi:hypothetical protein BCT19_19755 [Vibrio splendidus]|uniref:hypothetical protein n=1 Tax=Vibrio splendidus TaxID=29497 RepID=UPI000C840CED|nr:hypothetical protein [Vibrio splendidus]MDH5932423.1 hypothetical protein [Vibrio splendidus]MDH5937810.1 hypothetical protein [Vibrio splendidus]PMO02530.1 hypothetical protein BCT19_19755 [Vibrio splendidus]PTQ17347.1 hypothetical protein CWO33_03585 [Vibrio splendidus]